jgi:ABC-type transport system substrate-binding protein/class 3 adenylate cyclase
MTGLGPVEARQRMGDSPRDGEADARQLHRGIRTFLIADVRGYTMFTQERGDEAAAKLAARFASIAREVVEEHGGSVIELRGDEALAAFDSARQAILAAARSQDRFLEETLADPVLPLPVGIGIDAGEAVPLEAGFRGGALNLAARLCGRAGPGEILASQGVTHLAGKVEGVRYVDRGELHLKGMADPVRVVRVISEEGDPAEGFLRLAPGRPPGRRAPVRLARRHPIVAILAALALVAAIAVPTTIALRGGDGRAPIAGDALAMVDLESGELEASVPLGSRPGGVATGAGSVWVTLPDRGAVVQIDVETMSIIDTVPVGADPVDVAIGADSVWVANGGSSTVSRISPARNNEVVDTIEVPGAPTAIAASDRGVWVADSVGDAVAAIDPDAGEVLTSIPVGDQPVDLADDGHDLWVANATSGSVSRVDVSGNAGAQPVDVGEGPQAVAVGPGGIYVANFLDGTVSRIDRDLASTDAVRVGEGPTDLAFGGGSLWVSLGSAGSIKKIVPRSGSVAETPIGSYAGSLALGDGVLWVGVSGVESAHRGGTLTIAALRSFRDSIDPALAYSPLTWSILSLTNDGLVGFRRVGGVEGATMVPNLATSIPDPADGGMTYRFQLRPGIRYSSGDPVRPEDFRRAIERVFSLGSEGSFYYETVVGAEDCQAGSCDLSAGIETDDEAGSVTFHLVEPDPDFLNKLTMPFAFAVPAGTTEVLGETTPVPATGPYRIEPHAGGGSVVLVRNPVFEQWSAARPDGFPDRIVFRLDPDSVRTRNGQVDDTLEGDLDLMWAAPPADLIDVLTTTHAGQLHSDPVAATRYVFLNEETPPFDDERVRRALNYAVDRRMIIDQVWGGPEAVRVTCQILPPTFPGYEPYCPYTLGPDRVWTAPDLPKARQLVNASGTAGMKVVVWATPNELGGWTVLVGRHFVDLLEQLGYDAKLKVVSGDRYFSAVADPSRHVQVGFWVWAADYLGESGFLPALTCVPVGSDRFCDPTIERRIEQATSMQLTDPAASHELWTDLEHDLVDLAPWVPVGNTIRTVLVSRRLGNYQFHPFWWELYDQMWVR